MLIKTKIIGITLGVAGLSACSSSFYQHSDLNPYQSSTPGAAVQLYPDGYDNGGAYAPKEAGKQQIVVPETYHVGTTQAPASFKDRDSTWISSQNPQGYTIEVAPGEKAAEVAGTLQKVPKNERMAEVKYQQDGKTYYKGIYGTYPSYEAAQQALSALPEEVKQSAGIKTWGSVQSSVTE